ncbi:MAG TPA: DUF6272 family protein [Flavobacteriales bacterium]|nr:DUF6272 family protein [Flavobacteriales bacterium]
MEKNLLQYKGQLTSEVRVQLLDLINCIALFNLGQRNDLKRLVGIALELLDNAQRYNASGDVDFHWHIENEVLIVTIANKASREDAQRLVDSVETIGRMTPEEISDAFKKQLMNEQFGEKGGAGLGMLQIARKVGNNITADIRPGSGDTFICRSTVSADLNQKKRA